MSSRKFLYFPVEIAARELDARLLLAQIVSQGNAEVILGQKWLMETNLSSMPKGVWLFKTMTPRDARVMQKIKAAGHAVTVIDEEVTALAEGTGGLVWVSPEGVDRSDRIFCQGQEHHKSMVARFPQHAEKLRVTGNPRWDLLRPEMRGIFDCASQALRRAHGRIILINTNSSIGNPAKGKTGEQLLQEMADAGKISLSIPEERNKWEAHLAFDRANLAATLSLVHALARRYSEHTIVVRPHPSEGAEYYTSGLRGIKNAAVIFEGTAATWISAADVLIHTQCTTGIEAFALGKPAINYEVGTSPVNTRNISGRLSIVARSEDEVLELVARRITGIDGKNDLLPDVEATFRRFFSAQEGELAAEAVAREMVDPDLMPHPSYAADPDVAVWRPGWAFRPRWRMTRHRRKVFPPVTPAALQARLEELSRALGHAHAAEISLIGDTMFHVRRRGMAPPPVGTFAGRAASRLFLGR